MVLGIWWLRSKLSLNDNILKSDLLIQKPTKENKTIINADFIYFIYKSSEWDGWEKKQSNSDHCHFSYDAKLLSDSQLVLI